MAPQKAPDPHADPEDAEHYSRMLCYVCETDLTGKLKNKEGKKEKSKDKERIRPGLVAISSEGTGFAGGGANMAKKSGTAFQC